MTNRERRDRGLAYLADEDLLAEMSACKRRLKKVNDLDPWDYEKIVEAEKEVIPHSQDLYLVPPFYCDYGTNITLGKHFAANVNCTFLDVAPIEIGDNCMLGPGVLLCTAGHPMHPAARATGYEYGKPIRIGSNCWLGGNVSVLPGVTIGDNVIIGTGSVVTHDIPSDVVAVGNPCRVLRPITEDDRRILWKKEEIDDEAWNLMENRKKTQD